MRIFKNFYIFFIILLISSCFKKDPKWTINGNNGNGLVKSFDMGSDFQQVIFFDCENGNYVTRHISEWDLAFSTDENNFYIKTNSGYQVKVFHTQDTNFYKSYPSPSATQWQYDDPSGSTDSFALKFCYNTLLNKVNKSVFLINYIKDTAKQDNHIKVFQMIGKSSNGIKFRLRDLKDPNAKTHDIYIQLNPDYSHVYFRFRDLSSLLFEPPINTWDFKMTKYTDVLLDNGKPYPYLVRGVILNNFVKCSVDSLHTYDELNLNNIQDYKYYTKKDIIGYDWKYYDFTLSRYNVRPNRNYIIHNRNGSLFKLKFIDYYSETGKPNFPKFMYKKIN